VRGADATEGDEADARPWRWGLIVGVGVLVLAILAALFLLSRPLRALAPQERAGIAVRATPYGFFTAPKVW
jgi:hypothetical protein